MRNSLGYKIPLFDLVMVWGGALSFLLIAIGYIAKASGWWDGF